MKIVFKWLLAVVYTLCVGHTFAQFDAFDEKKTYSKELSYGFTTNTNAGLIGGGSIKYSIRRTETRNLAFIADLVNVKYRKEARVATETGRPFILGKINYLFALRTQVAQEFLLFRKYEEQGIRLQGVLAAGPSFGFVKPYYIEYNYTERPFDRVIPDDSLDIRFVPYDPDVHVPNYIRGSGSFFSGFDELKVVAGFNLKAGLNFEFGFSERYITALETGFTIEAYNKYIPLFDTEDRKQVYNALYLTLYFGTKY